MNVPKLRFKEFNDEYRTYFIKDLGDVITGTTPSTSDKENYGDEFLWASPIDMGLHKYINDTKNKLSKKGFKKVRTIPKDSILVTCIGSTIGKMGVASKEMATNQQINTLICNDNFENNYMYYCIGYNFPRFLNKISFQAVPIISKSEFEKLLLTCSINKQEQTKVANFLSLLDKKIELQTKKIEDLKLFKLCIMKSIFDSSKASINLKIKDISLIEKGKQINGDQLLEFGDYYMLNGGINPSGYLNVYNRNENTITISEGGNSCGYVSFNKNKFWCGGHCYSVSPININNEYLYQLLKYNERKIMDLRVGSGLPNIQKKDLENLFVKIHNNSDQENISILLSKYDSKLDLEIIKLNILTKLKKGLMQNMFV